jgi:hypothetical protein
MNWMGTRTLACILPAPGRGLMLLVALLPCLAAGQQYTHELLVGGLRDFATGCLNDSGDYFVRLPYADHTELRINGVELPPNEYDFQYLRVAGLDNAGGWLGWGPLGPDEDNWRALWNNEIVDEGWSPYPWNTINAGLCADGTAYWTNGGYEYAAVMRNGVDFSTQWTDGVYDNLKRITPGGKALWYGREPGAAGPELWFDGISIMRGYDTGEWEFNWEGYAINDSGVFAWTAGLSDDPVAQHVFVGQHDLTEAVLGPDARSGDRVFVNNCGQVGWGGGLMGTTGGMYIDDVPKYHELQGPSDYAHMLGLNDAGDLVWELDRPVGQRDSLYMNDFDLVEDVYGGTAVTGLYALDLNERGQVLWTARYVGGNYDLWLSTPVPEPSPLLLPLLALLLRGRRQRGGPSRHSGRD